MMRLALRGAMSATLALALIAPRSMAAQDDGHDLFRGGKYQQAIAALNKVPASDSDWAASQRDLVRAYAAIGKYDEAEAAGRRAVLSPKGGGGIVWNPLGEVLITRGKRAAAESAFVRARSTPDSLIASLNLAVLHYDRGDRDQAMKEFDKFIDVYNRSLGNELTSDDLMAVAIACEYLGENDPQLFHDAQKAYDRATTVDPSNDAAKIRLGELFLRKYNFEEAQKAFEEVLQTNPNDPRALLGAARRLQADGQAGGDSLLRAALTVNPEYPDAHVLHAEVLLGLEDYAAAQVDIDRALKVDPVNERALAVAAAIKFLTHDQAGFETLRQRALAADPRDAELYATLAELAADVRLYKSASDFARQGVALDAKDWHAWSVLGMNQLRLGQIDTGRASLEKSFKGDPYNVWVKNTLDLLDTYKNYDLTASPRFQFMIEKDESPILSIYLRDLAEQAYTTFEKKYAYTPPPPVRIEVYRSHADFSVRTVGLAGLGALGVSFGTTLAFDSPAAKDAGPFNWGSTVWHELAHTFTLGSTDNRIPRWLSEGLSVYEEHHARPGWGFGVTPDFLAAYKAGKLVPVSRMNDGFMHPAYPEQVQFSYYQASLVCELIARDFGEPAILRMLQAYKDGQTTDQVFQKVLNTDLKSFDKRFDTYLNTRFGAVLASIDEDAPEDRGQHAGRVGDRDGRHVAQRLRRATVHGRGADHAQRPRPGHSICRARAGDLSRVRRRRQSVRASRDALPEERRPAQGSRCARQVDVAHRDQPESAGAARDVARAARRREGRRGRARSRDVRESVRRRHASEAGRVVTRGGGQAAHGARASGDRRARPGGQGGRVVRAGARAARGRR